MQPQLQLPLLHHVNSVRATSLSARIERDTVSSEANTSIITATSTVRKSLAVESDDVVVDDDVDTADSVDTVKSVDTGDTIDTIDTVDLCHDRHGSAATVSNACDMDVDREDVQVDAAIVVDPVDSVDSVDTQMDQPTTQTQLIQQPPCYTTSINRSNLCVRRVTRSNAMLDASDLDPSPSDAPPLTTSKPEPAPAAKITILVAPTKTTVAKMASTSPSKLLVENTVSSLDSGRYNQIPANLPVSSSPLCDLHSLESVSVDRIINNTSDNVTPAKRLLSPSLQDQPCPTRVKFEISSLCSDVSVPEDHESPSNSSITYALSSSTVDSALISVPEPGSMLTTQSNTNDIPPIISDLPCPSSIQLATDKDAIIDDPDRLDKSELSNLLEADHSDIPVAKMDTDHLSIPKEVQFESQSPSPSNRASKSVTSGRTIYARKNTPAISSHLKNVSSHSSIWDPEWMFKSRKSPLIQFEGKAGEIFTKSIWNTFSIEDQQELMALLPSVDLVDERESMGGTPLINTASKSEEHPKVGTVTIRDGLLRRDFQLVDSLQLFMEHLSGGFYMDREQTFMVENLHEVIHKYDAWKEEHYEDVWGDQLDVRKSDSVPDVPRAAVTPRTKPSTKSATKLFAKLVETPITKFITKAGTVVSLRDICMGALILVGDVLAYKRMVLNGYKVNLRGTVESVDKDGVLCVRYGKELWDDLQRVDEIEQQFLNSYRPAIPSNVRIRRNGWRSIHVFRNKKLIGSLLDLRRDFFMADSGN
ncbi:hypothetical protein BASA61_008690 [Batrachochytrium salamandrivorans]|nr:hypothetical protein BASA61_008690 [Batrachochytrium salamandrivorans]KAH9268295.1 hypothetical protein BASA83_009456 [Batrachochytrium salamandrivorans]